jgi:hypothetical protein
MRHPNNWTARYGFDVHAKMVTLVEKCGLFDEVEMRLPKALDNALR